MNLRRSGRLAGTLALLCALAVPSRGQGDPPTDPAFYASEVFRLTNEARLRIGLPPLVRNVKLETAAAGWNQAMDEGHFFAHTVPGSGISVTEAIRRRMVAAGYVPAWWGENIAVNYEYPAELVQDWLSSAAHRANILRPQFKDLGVAVRFGTNSGYSYVTQDFGSANTPRRRRRGKRRTPEQQASLPAPTAALPVLFTPPGL